MPRVSLSVTYNRAINDIQVLSQYVTGFANMDAKYQHIIGEVIMLRLFSVLESTISETALKIACGARYRNGGNATILCPCNSLDNAHHNMLTHNRNKALRYLQWTKASFVNDSIRHVLDLNDHYARNISNHSISINEMRVVRNHIAHNSASTRTEYNNLLRSRYGGNPKITVGAFLVSTNRTPTANISKYITTTQIIVNDITMG